MLNIEKVKSMTRAAAYENGPEKRNIEIGNYFRGDYVGFQMLKSAFAYTVAFGILAALWFMGRIEDVMLMLSRAEYLQKLIKGLVVFYLSGLAVYEGAVYFYYSMKYQEAKKSLKGYNAHLKRIHEIYETQADEEITI